MRRKVIQDFANVFCQRILLLPEGYDLATFVHYGSGVYELNILNDDCRFNGNQIPKMRTSETFKQWLFVQLEEHHIPTEAIEAAELKIKVRISQLEVGLMSQTHEFALAHFSFDCHSEIRTSERSYTSKMSGEKKWGFDWYYQQLYGSVLKLATKD